MSDDRLVDDETKMYLLKAYCKRLSDSLRESDVRALMKDDEIRRLRAIIDSLKESAGRTGFLVDRAEDSGSVIICGPTNDEITMCAMLLSVSRELVQGGEE